MSDPRLSAARLAMTPDRTLPLVYFGFAHVALALAAGILAVRPDLPGAFHYHPRLIAIVHLVTLGWISGSILGAFYIVAPLAFGMPFPARRSDRVACVLFWLGTAGMVSGFWRGDYPQVGMTSVGVLFAMALAGLRALSGWRKSRLPAGVALHVGLAFFNILLAGGVGTVMAVARACGVHSWSPLAAAAAHAHLAVLGWAAMMFIGVSYRLVPMFLPAAMPTGRDLCWSAVLLEVGTVGLAASLLLTRSPLPWSLVVVGAIVTFALQVRKILGHRRPRPFEMQGRDWSTWQTHAALFYMMAAAALGLWLAAGGGPASLTWAYGVAGILGFVAQSVVGIQGRLLPLHAWYRAMTCHGGNPPPVSAHRLTSSRAAKTILALWSSAVPLLALGLTAESHTAIAIASCCLCASTLVQAWHMWAIATRARAQA